MSCWHCGSTLVSYTRGGKFKYFEWQIFFSHWICWIQWKHLGKTPICLHKWIVPLQSYCRQRVSGTNHHEMSWSFLHVTKWVSYGQPSLVPHMIPYILQTITLFDSDKTAHLSINQIKGIGALYVQTLKQSKCDGLIKDAKIILLT